MTTQEIIARLKEGNARFINAVKNDGDISKAVRIDTAEHGQHPYAVVISCADSRVVPEDIFMAGIGEIFDIRVAGNVIAESQMGSIEYAVGHLGCRLILVLGHTNCGAVGAAIEGGTSSYVKTITDRIKSAVGSETDSDRAARLNVMKSVKDIKEKLTVKKDDFAICGAIYDIREGRVDWL